MEDSTKIVIEEYGGIVPFNEAFYLEAIIYAAGAALEAFWRFDERLKDGRYAGAIVAALHEALTNIAALSRFFWPVWNRGVTEARGKKLVAAFGLKDNSPLLTNKELRDALEHFDERLDKFLLVDRAGHFFPSSEVGTVSLNDDPITHIFRLVDPVAEVFVLLGKQYPYGAIRKEIEAIFDAAKSMQENGGRLK